MVCQAASQTRFRALKHESGIAGRPTIIVRIIACFQSMQNCQVARSFGWMVTARESRTCQQFSAWNSSYLDYMTLLQLEQNYCLPCFPPSTPTANVALQGQSAPDVRGLNTAQYDNVGRFLKPVPQYYNISYPTGNTCLKGSHCSLVHGLGVADKPIDASHAPQKKLLIFDQSGNHTRLFFSPSFLSQNQIFASKTPVTAMAGRVDQQFLMKPIVEEKWDENHLTDEEDEMLENSEEINALLYSDTDNDDDDDDDDDDEENDEVTSTGHSPLSIEEDYYEDKKILTEEVASSDGSPKRRRLLDGKYKKPSFSSDDRAVNGAISCNYEVNAESSCPGDDHLDSSCKRETKVKIRQAMNMLESIVPGLNSKDPLSIIDKAIVYLKSMKVEAEALGHCKSATSPP